MVPRVTGNLLYVFPILFDADSSALQEQSKPGVKNTRLFASDVRHVS